MQTDVRARNPQNPKFPTYLGSPNPKSPFLIPTPHSSHPTPRFLTPLPISPRPFPQKSESEPNHKKVGIGFQFRPMQLSPPTRATPPRRHAQRRHAATRAKGLVIRRWIFFSSLPSAREGKGRGTGPQLGIGGIGGIGGLKSVGVGVGVVGGLG